MLWVTGQNLSVPSFVGFIALLGIALENGMVLVTYLNQLVRDGMGVDAASIRGACQRLRPVLMTAFTTMLGLLPLLFSSGTGGEARRPLATVVVGGGGLSRRPSLRFSWCPRFTGGSPWSPRRCRSGRVGHVVRAGPPRGSLCVQDGTVVECEPAFCHWAGGVRLRKEKGEFGAGQQGSLGTALLQRCEDRFEVLACLQADTTVSEFVDNCVVDEDLLRWRWQEHLTSVALFEKDCMEIGIHRVCGS